jgi:hypothetical protein
MALAFRDLRRLRTVLREANDASQRTLAAQVIAYTPDKREVIGDLIGGMRDPWRRRRSWQVRELVT